MPANTRASRGSRLTGLGSRPLSSSGVRERFQPRQADEATGPLDGMHEPEDVIENLGVVRLPLNTHELDVDYVETLICLGHKLPQQVIHWKNASPGAFARIPLPIGSAPSVSAKSLILVADLFRNGHFNHSLTPQNPHSALL
jgi:hypothetical protein